MSAESVQTKCDMFVSHGVFPLTELCMLMQSEAGASLPGKPEAGNLSRRETESLIKSGCRFMNSEMVSGATCMSVCVENKSLHPLRSAACHIESPMQSW